MGSHDVQSVDASIGDSSAHVVLGMQTAHIDTGEHGEQAGLYTSAGS